MRVAVLPQTGRQRHFPQQRIVAHLGLGQVGGSDPTIACGCAALVAVAHVKRGGGSYPSAIGAPPRTISAGGSTFSTSRRRGMAGRARRVLCETSSTRSPSGRRGGRMTPNPVHVRRSRRDGRRGKPRAPSHATKSRRRSESGRLPLKWRIAHDVTLRVLRRGGRGPSS
jgi:hypothetical protein